MNLLKRIFSTALVLCFLFALFPAAYAEEEINFADKTWEELVEELLERWDAEPERVGMGYYNLVTGEEQYYNGDQYMVSGSMYKVPLNMVWAEKVADGEMDMDTMVGAWPYEELLKGSIVYSNNEYARTLWEILGNGSYRTYRRIIAPIMGEDPDQVDAKYYENNFFTPRQMIHCLRTLAENPERYPGVIEAMQKAEPNNYFKLREKRFDIGHKYGFLQTEWHLYMDDCAVCYTDDPIVIVCFTDNINKAYDVLTEFCTLMCDYTQYHTAIRIQEEEEAARLAQLEAMNIDNQAEPTPEPSPEATPVPGIAEAPLPAAVTPAPERTTAETAPSLGLLPLLLAVLVIAAALGAVAFCARWKQSRGLRFPWVSAAIALTALCLLLLLFAPYMGTLSAKPTGDPQETVVRFFDALIAGDYDTANACLSGKADLGLSRNVEDPAQQVILDALRHSYSYTLFGDCQQRDRNAYQQVQFQSLDVASLQRALPAETSAQLMELARQLPPEEVFDENSSYLPGIPQRAYEAAVLKLMEGSGEYRLTTGIQVELSYQRGGWKLVPSANLLKLLSGGV